MSDLSNLEKNIFTATLPGTDKTKNDPNAQMRDKIFIDTDVSLKRKNSPDNIRVTDFAIACGATVDERGYAPLVIRKLGEDKSDDNKKVKIINPHICLKNTALSSEYPFGVYRINQSSKADRTITFANWVWPQTVYPDTFKLDGLMQNGDLTKTGRIYPYTFDASGNALYCEEYSGMVDGKMRKFVRFTPKANIGQTFSDGKTIESKPYWFEVSPIVWKIENAKDLIENISPRNYVNIPKATPIEIIPSTGLMAGLPLVESDYSLSRVRNFMNGYGQYQDRGFLDYSIDPTKDQTKNRFSVVVEDQPMTIDQQLRFYIDNNFSIMLHGASGIGKSRRVKDIDPECVMIQLRDGILPEEVIGKTAFNDETGKSSWIEPTWYTRIKEVCAKDPKHNHVLFIDEKQMFVLMSKV